MYSTAKTIPDHASMDSRQGIFPLAQERINLGMGIGFLAITLVEVLFYNYAVTNSIDPFLFALIINVVLFNITHVPLTFVMMWKLPELKEWSAHPSHFIHPKKQVLILSIGLFAILTPFFAYLISDPANGGALGKAFKTVIFATAIHHGLWQMRGLSLWYNRIITPSDHRAARKSEAAERLGFYGVLICELGLLGLLIFPELVGEYKVNLQYSLIALITLSLVVIFLGASSYPNANQTNEFLYLLRLMIVPFKSFSLFAGASLSGLHGVEYMGVFERMRSKSQISSSSRSKVLWIAILLMLAFGFVFAYGEYFYGEVQRVAETPIWIALFKAAVVSLTMTHFYTDRLLFKMRNPATRRHVGGLINR